MTTARFAELATVIAESTTTITECLTVKGLSAPSFDVDGLTELPISPADKAAYSARLKLIAATKELHDLAVGPKESLRHLAWDVRFPWERSRCCIVTNANLGNSLSTASRFAPYTTLKSQNMYL